MWPSSHHSTVTDRLRPVRVRVYDVITSCIDIKGGIDKDHDHILPFPMSRRSIVSWKISDPRVSPVVSSASGGSVVSINSIISDMMTTEPAGAQAGELGATKLTGTNWPGSANPSTVESFVQHDIYSFKDGNITFLVDGTLYCVHRYFFSRDSIYFSTKFSQLDVRDHEPLTTIISLGDVERKDFEAFLSVLYPENFEEHGLSYEQWKSVLHLSTRWGFASLRKLALKSIDPPTSFDRLLLARTYSVDHWVLPALSALCERTKPISLKEALQMNMEDVVLVATVREEIRTRGPFVNIKDRIEAAQDRMVAHLVNGDDFAVDSESEADERVSLKGEVTGIGAEADSHNGTRSIEAAIPPKVVDGHGSGEHSTEIAEDPSAELPARKKSMRKAALKAERTRKHSRLVCKTGENAGANMPQSAPIAGPGESEEKYVSDAIPEEDGEKRPTPNAEIYGSGWFSKLTAMQMPPEDSPFTRRSSQGLTAPIRHTGQSELELETSTTISVWPM
ncbi:hypothetical protein F5888DRAFT_1657649, partial [Russula emetica]